ncbi:peptidase C65 Otubain-domain-containing protein [Xylaria palmicola]|nr:peptidase C65 Otubain-domain-containing protein [Xylaria palmicola]
MFQAQPTPYSPFSLPYGLHVANAGIPDYTFAPTPLFDQFGGGPVGGSTASTGDAGGVVGGRCGPATAFPAAPNVRRGNFPSASASGGPAAMGVGVQGLGSAAVAASENSSAGYSSGSGSIHPCLYNIPMPVSVPSAPPHTQQQHQSQQHQSQQHQRQHQLQRQHQQHQHQHQHLPRRPHPSDRTAIPYEMDQPLDLDPTEISREEAAARDFEPQLEGPLVGEKVSSQAIIEEYAGADPIFVSKTLALPQTYPHYRPIQGDGNCGWRAIAFAYFEILVQCGNINLVQSELQRMTALNKYIEEVGGQDPTILELMVEGTLMLFNDIIVDMSEGNDPMSTLIAKFNDSQTSQCLVYHLRLLACARLKGNAAQYELFLHDGVENYLNKTVMPVNKEIDHICVALVHDILLKPADIVLDIAYLDRSEGTKVNIHRFPEEAKGQDPSTLGPIISLLYRPDHYDILYRESQVYVPRVPAVSVPVDLQINRVDSFVTHSQDFENPVPALQDTSYNMDMSILAAIPGLASTFGPPSAASSPMTGQYAPSPTSFGVPQQFTPEGISVQPPAQPSPLQHQATEHPLRFSKWNFQVAPENNSTHEPPFTTNTFKNSHFNTAHYNNLNFQPEMYQPDADEEVSSIGNSKTSGRKRSTEHCPSIKKEK